MSDGLVPEDPNGEADGMSLASRPPTEELDLVGAGERSPDEVLSLLGSRTEGLTSEEVEERLRRFGLNVLGIHRVRATTVLFRQIRNPILILLLGAALISGFTGGGTNAVIIFVIVFLSVGLGFFNEYRAAIAMASLRVKIRQEAEVRRSGQTCRVAVTDLVPGDIVELRIGAIVPADIRLISVEELECDEGILTGESMPVSKSAAPSPAEPRTNHAPSWARSCTRGRPLASSCRPGRAPPSDGSPRA